MKFFYSNIKAKRQMYHEIKINNKAEIMNAVPSNRELYSDNIFPLAQYL